MLVRGCVAKNWGDNLNVELVRLISGKVPKMVNNKFTNPDNETIHMCIGSVIQWADKNTVIWGTGSMSDTDTTMFKEKPKSITAVRGPRTRDKLIRYGYDCPDIFGDPALLMPRFYNPSLEKKYKLSVIPHAIDKCLIPQLKKEFPTAHFIDVQQDTYPFIDEVIRSEYIISSTLHGCICADAYGVLNEWRKFSDKVLGNGWKFFDYFESKPYINLDKLMEVCPFRRES